jgi:membrane protein implicated in regulation of membrane protease activity
MVRFVIILLIGLIAIWAPSINGEDADRILNKRSESIGHYKKDGDRIVISDKHWNKKGHIKISGKDWERGGIFDSKNRRLGHFEKKGNHVDIYDKRWNRKGYGIVDDGGQRYFNKKWERVDPGELFNSLEQDK